MSPLKRTDPHRPGAIVPADYVYLLSYNLATTMDNWPIPAFRIDCEIDRRKFDKDGKIIARGEHGCPSGYHGHTRCCALRARENHGLVDTGRDHGLGKCTVCGAHFVFGDVWLHVPSGQIVHLGHKCAEKYEMMADRSEWEREHGRARAATGAAIAKAQKREECQSFLAQHPGLADDLKVEHEIIADIDSRFRRFGDISAKQVALVRKLAEQVRNPPPPEDYVDAPTGRIEFTGRIVSFKAYEGDWGISFKITVKVETDEGVWLAWGTCPQALLDANTEAGRDEHGYVNDVPWHGSEVKLRATLKRGRDPHFAVMSRPHFGGEVTWPERKNGEAA